MTPTKGQTIYLVTGGAVRSAKVVQVDFTGFGALRNSALAACTHEWIFSLDADERCTPEAEQEIRAITNSPDALDVYWMPRRNYFMGRWIRHSGWYPNYRQPQLFRNGAMEYDLKPVHEGYVLKTDKPIGHLQNPIWQFPFKNMAEVMHKSNRYSTLGAEKIQHKKISMGMALGHGIWSFVKHYNTVRGLDARRVEHAVLELQPQGGHVRRLRAQTGQQAQAANQ